MGNGASSKTNEVVVIQAPASNGDVKENLQGTRNISSNNLNISRIEILERRCKFLSDENNQLKTSLINLENERSDLIKDINSLEEEIKELSSEASLNAVKENFQNLIDGKDIIIKNLEIQLKANELRINETKIDYEAKIQRYLTKIDDLKKKHALKMSKNSEALERLEAQNKALNEQLNALSENANTDIRSKLIIELSSHIQEKDSIISNLNEELEEKEIAIAALKKEVDELRSGFFSPVSNKTDKTFEKRLFSAPPNSPGPSNLYYSTSKNLTTKTSNTNLIKVKEFVADYPKDDSSFTTTKTTNKTDFNSSLSSISN